MVKEVAADEEIDEEALLTEVTGDVEEAAETSIAESDGAVIR